MTIDPADVAAWQAVLEHTYGSGSLSPAVVADGYALQLTVQNGQLNIIDGVGTHRRHRTITRSNRIVKRIVVLGRSGTITLAALRWCTQVGISVSVIDPDGTLTAASSYPNPNDARLRRAQASALGTPTGRAIARQLIAAKITGHAEILESLEYPNEATLLRTSRDILTSSPSLELDRIREIEAFAASIYFSKWSETVSANFAVKERFKVPRHWLLPSPRQSPLTYKSSPRKAADPVNAILNYAYALGESIVRHACHTVGLDPALGVMHADKKHRDSMALDILEPLRPVIDNDILRLVQARCFRRLDFTETADGQCRLTESVTHHLTTALPSWSAQISPTVEWVAHTLSESSPSKITQRTPLTQRRRLDARPSQTPRRGTKPPAPTRPIVTCRECGSFLVDNRRTVCTSCWVDVRKDLAIKRANHAVENRQSIIERTAQDPAQTPTARARRATSLRAERAARNEWNRQHSEEDHDRSAFTREILLGLSQVPLRRITQVTGMSDSAASRVRSGKLIPHPRHWAALRELADQTG